MQMKFMKSFGSRSSSNEDEGPSGGAPEAGSPEGHELPIDRYDQLDGKQLTEQLRGLTQAELEVVETYERTHRDRENVLAKLRYLRQTEPLPGYDELDSGQIAEQLAGADSEKVKAVRDYERKFQRRHDVLKETARVLPESEPSAKETNAREEKEARVRAKMRPTSGRAE